MFLAVDPGRSKCGLALLDINKKVWQKKTVLTKEIFDEVNLIMLKYKVIKVIVGNGTSSQEFCVRLREKSAALLNDSAEDRLVLVEEAFTTVEGKKRYWADHPPAGWKKWLPLSWLTLPRPVDDYVAVILAERYIDTIGQYR